MLEEVKPKTGAASLTSPSEVAKSFHSKSVFGDKKMAKNDIHPKNDPVSRCDDCFLSGVTSVDLIFLPL